MKCVLGCLIAVVAACGVEDVEIASLTQCPGSNVIADPPQFQWTFHPAGPGNPQPYFSGILEYGQATFTINGQTLTTRAYRQTGGAYSIPGPTIKMMPGSKYVLRYRNLLPFEPASTEHNVLKDPNVSNLHTHGVHISGESPSDDVTRFFEGGRGGDFVYDIPANHMGGTYWYHAHHHGSTFLQVSSGAFGLMLIDDGNDNVPANVAAMVERQLVVAFLDPTVAGTGGDTLISGTLPAGWTVNGTVGGGLCTPANEWQHWRVLLADRQATEKTLGVGANCEVQLLARDGVWRTTAPLALPTRALNLTGASRADFAVRCTNDSVITINGSTIANLFVFGPGNTTVGPFSNGSSGGTWSAQRPPYLRDLRGASGTHAETIHMGARTVNGSKFDHDVPNLTLASNQVQSWTLAGNSQHPFHLHVYHVQSQDCGGAYEPGEYYDTIADPCTVRFDLDAATSSVYEGRTIMHCHILEHEDQGAMGWADVVGGLPPPSFPADTTILGGYAESYTEGTSRWCTTNAECSNGNACDGVEVCDGTGTCVAGAPLVCNDGNSCTSDTCNPATGCTAAPVADGTACGDGNVCNGSDTCQAGTCATAPAPNCDDANPCTIDSCDAMAGCTHVATSCTGAATCSYDAGSGTITVTMRSLSASLTIASGAIKLGTTTCGTTTDTDTIVVNGLGLLTIKGDYGPGRTLEGSGASEIEIAVNNDKVTFDFDVGADTVRIFDAGADVNGDGDQDITLSGTQTTVLYKGGAGNDTLDASATTKKVTLYGGTNNDHLIGGSGPDTLYGEGDADTLEGNDGNDVLGAGLGVDIARGGNGNDTFNEDTTANGADTIDGGAGTDTLSYASRTVPISVTLGDGIANEGAAGEGDSVAAIEYVNGGAADDTLVGDALANVLTGNNGNDTLAGGGGNDTLRGSAGNDTLDGNDGNDTLTGGAGDDIERGGIGNDSFTEDTAANGADSMDGGDGIDLLSYTSRTSTVSVNLGDGLANEGAPGEADAPVNVENVTGGAGADTIIGNDLNNTLRGGAGNDTMFGRGGADPMYGDAGDDTLDGELGADTMNGGLGNDRLVGDPGSTDVFIGDAGNDTIVDNNDGRVESVNCGTGTDTAESGEDTFTACEILVAP